MKKLFISLLCLVMASSMTACANSNMSDENPNTTASAASSEESSISDSSVDVSDSESSETVSDGSESTDLSENIIRAEELYEEDEEEYALIESLQGKIKYIEQNNAYLTFIAENKVYITKYGGITPKIELSGDPEQVQYFNNVEIGENVYCYTDNKISLYNDNGELRFKDVEFNPETDCVYADMGDNLFVMSKQSDGYRIKYYEITDEKEAEIKEENMLTEYETVKGDDITDQVKEIQIVPSNKYGFEAYCITNNNELYWANDIHEDSLEMSTSKSMAKDVDTIYAQSYVTTYTTTPVYSKVDDEKAVYSVAPGASIVSAEDNIEIAFPMPDNHVPSEIKDIFNSYGALVFVFDNGDTYITEDIEKTGTTEYKMTKLEEVSEMNADGKIVDMTGGGSALEKYVYLLTDTNELYAYIIK